jgi:hypothetical protein
MNWDMISAIGQMLAAIGVIISIVYLAAQIRNQNKESQRQAMNVLTTHWSDLTGRLWRIGKWQCFGFGLFDRSTISMQNRN